MSHFSSEVDFEADGEGADIVGVQKLDVIYSAIVGESVLIAARALGGLFTGHAWRIEQQQC